MTEDWKDFIKTVDNDILEKLYVVACKQSECPNYGNMRGTCSYCADTAESIVGEYLHLISLK